jgi:predicted Zn finger-like uncharacterized protein
VIVACERCETRFQLDDARVPANGIRVRCSRCKHAFVVQRPDASAADAIHAIAQDAARNAHSAPPATSDFDETIRSTRPLVAEAPGPPAGGGDEEDWTFNEPSAPLSVKPSDERATSRRGMAPLAPPKEESIFAADAGSEEIPPPDEPSLDAIGSPENWDFGVVGGSEEGQGAVEAAPETGARNAPVPPHAAASSSQASATPGTGTQGSGPAASGAQRARTAVPKVRFDRMGLAGGADAVRWAACGILLALVAALALTPRPLPRTTLVAPTAQVGPLVVEGARGRLVENAVGGPLLVVSATLRNAGSEPASAGGRIAVTLLGVDADLSASAPSGRQAPAGEAPDEAALRLEDPAQLRDAIARSAEALAARTLAPGDAVPIGAVFVDLPRALSGIAIETSAATSAASLP